MSAAVIEWEPSAVSLGAAVVAMGVFDGVHVGHKTIITTAVEEARRRGVSSVVFTFDRDPDLVLTPMNAMPQLLTLEDKLRYIGELGVDTILVIPFCPRLGATPPERFMDDVLTDALAPRLVVVGTDFRFGQHAQGTVETLREYGVGHGFDVLAHDLVVIGGAPVTSTRIRGLVRAGDVAGAAALLGRAHRVAGRVVRGRGEGTALGVPTANVRPVAHAALPADGVYAGYAETKLGAFRAAISVGKAPSFDDARDVLEAHLIGFTGDLYATDMTLCFERRLRDLVAFDDTHELVTAMQADIAAAEESSL